jgi:hypothetical protein
MYRWLFALVLLLAIPGCGGAKLGKIEVPLARGVVTQSTLIQVEAVSAEGMGFAGDLANDRSLQGDDRFMISDQFAGFIVEELTDRGYRAELASEGARDGHYLILSGHVSKHDRGSVDQRGHVGAGAGDSTLTSYFTLSDNVGGPVLTEFEVVVSISENIGPAGDFSYLERHLGQSASVVARYLATGRH